MNDQRSTTARNITYLESMTNCEVVKFARWKVKQNLPVKSVPQSDNWRTSLLTLVLEARQSKDYSKINLSKLEATEMIISLCIS